MIKFWLSRPWFYDLIQHIDISSGNFLENLVKEIPNFEGKRVLDLGCGTGLLTPFVSSENYLGIDLNPHFVGYAKTKYPTYRFKVGDIVKDNLPRGSFDIIIIMNVLHHLHDDQLEIFLKKINCWKNTKQVVFIESIPRSFLGNILEKFDAGEDFRKQTKLEKTIKGHFLVSKKKVVFSLFGIYQYLMLICTT